MFGKTSRTLLAGLMGLGLAGGAQAQDDSIEFGWTAWSDAEFVTKLAARIIEDRYDIEVELTQTDIAPQYQGVAEGDIDAMLMAWLPATHENYYEEVADEVANLGVLYSGARLGWVVPDYIPEDEVSSIADLQGMADRFDGTITGIDPGAGLTQLSEEALETYELGDYTLQTSSGAGMTAALDRAIQREEWIVVTGWSPHWKFGAYDLRYLEDPEGALGGPERVHVLARQDFQEDQPEVADFLSRMSLPIDTLQDYMFQARETSYEEAVDAYIEENGARIDYWVTGEL